jgi:hypothetical protein
MKGTVFLPNIIPLIAIRKGLYLIFKSQAFGVRKEQDLTQRAPGRGGGGLVPLSNANKYLQAKHVWELKISNSH